ncbi:hypothetical protein [Yokenella regensburgei]|uniref:hypothetical protein n=1 Tax=Yokenella regensburgei TaxID=158877 RepID=UPI003EDA20EA
MNKSQRIFILIVIVVAVIWFRIPSDDWKVDVQDDAFSMGKQATLVSRNGSDKHVLVMDCTTKNIRLALGRKGRLPDGVIGAGELSVRIDQGSPIIFKNVLWKSEGDYTFAQVFATETPSEFGLFLHSLNDAKEKIQVGFKGVNSNSSAENTSAEFGVKGLGKAARKFMESCKITFKTSTNEQSIAH